MKVMPTECDECGSENTHLVQLGNERSSYSKVYICKACLEKAVELLKDEEKE